MAPTLTDRYVHAATRWMPSRARADISAELRERICDTIAARPTTADTEREVLEELGDPLRVATAYTGRQPTLIGPRHFFTWLRLTALLLAIVPPILTVLSALGSAASGASIGTTVAGAISVLLTSSAQVAFWTTLVFAIVDWTDRGAHVETWRVDRLPAPSTGTGTGALVSALVFSPILAALLVAQQFRAPFTDDAGYPIALVDPALWSWYLPLVLMVLALEMGHAIWVHRAGWTWPVAVANAAIAVLFATATVIVLLDGALINPALTERFGWDPNAVSDVMEWTALGVVLLALWEIFEGLRRARSQA